MSLRYAWLCNFQHLSAIQSQHWPLLLHLLAIQRRRHRPLLLQLSAIKSHRHRSQCCICRPCRVVGTDLGTNHCCWSFGHPELLAPTAAATAIDHLESSAVCRWLSVLCVTDMVQEMTPNSMMIGCLTSHVAAGITVHVLKLLSLLMMMTLFCVPAVFECCALTECIQFAEKFCIQTSGLPLGPLNPLKSFFKHMVHNVPISQKWSPKFLFLHNWQFFKFS